MTIENALSSPKFTKFATGVAGAVVGMTVVKGVARPISIYSDKSADEPTKRYAAVKELVYQAICLGATLAIIPPCKFAGLKFAGKISKNPDLQRINERMNIKRGMNKCLNEFKSIYLEFKENPEKHKKDADGIILGHGGIEFGSLIGSIIGLTVFAPLFSQVVLHPMMRKMGLEKKGAFNHAPKQNLDAKA